jgi:hypothetical protein
LENNMDMKQLIAQIDHIENKQILNEDAHYTAAQVDNRPQVSKSNTQTSIYEMLIKEFGYDLDERVTPDGKGGFTGGLTQQSAAAPATSVANPYQGADAAKFAAMSPADQAWLTKGGGVPNINDEIILSRAPNKGAAVVKPAAAPTTTSAATGVGNPGEQAAADADFLKRQQATNAQTAADAAAGATDMSLGQAGAVNAAASTPAATKPTGGLADPKKLSRYKELIAKAKGGAPAAAAPAAAPPAAAAPAAAPPTAAEPKVAAAPETTSSGIPVSNW